MDETKVILLNLEIRRAIQEMIGSSSPPKKMEYEQFIIYFVGANLLRIDIKINPAS